MKSPQMIFYIDEIGISHLHEQIEGGALVEATGTSAHEDSQQSTAGVEAGGGFLSLLNLAKLSLVASKGRKRSSAGGRRVVLGPDAHLGLVLKVLPRLAGSRYFESLDTAYGSAPEAEEGCSWVCVHDRFTLWRGGDSLSFDVLNRDQRFVFEIDPSRQSHNYGDNYFKIPKRAWRLTMTASFERFRRLKGRTFGPSSHEALYFGMYDYTDIPLNVFGCYLKHRLQVTIIPYAIWS